MSKQTTKHISEEEKIVDKWVKKSAIKDGLSYFDSVIFSLKNKIDEVEINKKNWLLALKRKPHPNGYIAEKRVIIEQIEWNVHAMQQVNMHHDLGCRAMVSLVKALKIDF